MPDQLKLLTNQSPTPKGWDKLPHDMCMCSTCGWTGPTDSCRLEEDSEGWEYPTYHYHICPVCELGGEDGEISDYWSSIHAVFDNAREEVAKL